MKSRIKYFLFSLFIPSLFFGQIIQFSLDGNTGKTETMEALSMERFDYKLFWWPKENMGFTAWQSHMTKLFKFIN